MGPKTENVELLKEMIKSGMNVARFNFSHGSHEEHAGRMALVEEAKKYYSVTVTVTGISVLTIAFSPLVRS